jgi:ADP-ribose pyrophosphatase YjhB (NUDIX family)
VKGNADTTSDISFAVAGVRFSVRVCGVAMFDGQLLLQRKHADPFWALPGGRCQMVA